ncbi:MAG: ABC transporter ATP-binding protein [Colwellia sp.]|jgi:ABC-type polysaccharide/polyol phosphate transport system, ATPase component
MNKKAVTILSANNISLKYKTRSGLIKRFEHTALNNVSFELYKGETLGILGRNGCGKSSLLKILTGVIRPTSGQVNVNKHISRSLLTLGLGFRNDLSGRDNAILSAMLGGLNKRDAIESLDEIKEFSELNDFFEQPVRTYSSGMRARLGFSTAIKTNVDILLIDEVLGVGDAHFKEKAQTYMTNKMNSEQTIVFVSHNIEQIHALCDRVIWVENGTVKSQGDTKKVSTQYQQFMHRL